MDYQRQLLEELMAPFETESKYNFWDDAVCKDFLVKFCPNQLFTNTKSDLGMLVIALSFTQPSCARTNGETGPCHKVHDEKLRAQ
jgi:hypothetical protein